MRVVQIEPGPMPIFTASAPAAISASTPSGVATLPATICTVFDIRLMRSIAASTPPEWPCAVSTTTTSTSAAISASTRRKPSSPTPVAAATRSRPRVLHRIRVRLRLVHVLDGDQADAAPGLVGHHQLLDPVAVQQVPRLVRGDVGGRGDQVVPRHQLIDPRTRVVGEAHVAVGDDADQPARAALDHRDAADAVLFLDGADIGQGLVGVDGDGVHHHAGFELLHPADLGGLFLRRHVLVDDADAAGLGHGDGHRALGHGVHAAATSGMFSAMSRVKRVRVSVWFGSTAE